MSTHNGQLVHIPRGERLESLGFGHLCYFKGLEWFGHKVWVVDVSEGGVKFEVSSQAWNFSHRTQIRLKPGAQRRLSLKLSSFPGFRTSLSLKVEVKWFDPNTQRGGCTFVNASASDKQKISAFLKYLADSKQSNAEKLEGTRAAG
jgi:PilZ domain